MPGPKQKKEIDIERFRGSKRPVDVLPRTIVIYSQPGAGKTTMAATAFGDMEPHLARKQETPLELKGAVWLLSDDQGLASLDARNIYPEFVIDVRKEIANYDGDVGAALRDIQQVLKAMAEAGATHVVSDTDTSLLTLMREWYVDGAGCPLTSGDTKNSIRGWGLLGKARQELHKCGSLLGLRWIVLCHVRELGSDDNPIGIKQKESLEERKKKEAKQTAKTTPGEHYLGPSLAGQMSKDLINAQSCIFGWLTVHEGPRKERVRVFFPGGGEGAMGKNRYEGILAEKEEPSIQKMEAKILANSRKAK